MNHLALISIAIVILASAAVAMSLRNLVHSALLLVVNWFGLAAFYLWAGAEFVALAQVLVYVGAVSMVVLFAVLLTRPDRGAGGSVEGPAPSGPGLKVDGGIGGDTRALRFGARSRGPDGGGPSLLLGLLAAGAVAGLLGWVVATTRFGDGGERMPALSVKEIGTLLTGAHALSLLVVGVILTVALVGAMLIAAPVRAAQRGGAEAPHSKGAARDLSI